MTVRTNARLAGFMFLIYIATGIASLVLFNRAVGGTTGTAAALASLAQHAALARFDVLLTILTFVCAVVLAVSLYALTRGVDRDLALMALSCRVAEGVISALTAVRTLALLSLATAAADAAAPDGAALSIGGQLLKTGGWVNTISAICFAFGSAIYSYLFLRGRMIPVPLAWLGVFASLLLVVVLPLQLAGFLTGAMTDYVWIPMLLFEVPLALWLIVKGVSPDVSPAT